jgi:hypothetical protein
MLRWFGLWESAATFGELRALPARVVTSGSGYQGYLHGTLIPGVICLRFSRLPKLLRWFYSLRRDCPALTRHL